MKYFQTLASELQLNKHLFTHYHNIPTQKQRQSSVAIIFRLNKQPQLSPSTRTQIQSLYQNFSSPQSPLCPQPLLTQILQNITDSDVEMLFSQRTANEADFNSGNVCFPGGKADGDESDLQACIREVRQEVGINLMSKESPYLNVYLGKFRHNFFYRQTRREKVFISCHLFLIMNPNVTMILNSSEIYDSKWINFNKLVTQTPFICRSKENITGLSSFPWPLKYLQNSIRSNLNCIKYSAIEVDLGSPLWGLSLHLYLHMLRIISNKLPKQQSKQLQQRIKMGETFEAEFSKFYPLAYPCEWFIKSWNKKNRINAFKEPPVKESRFKGVVWLLVLVGIVYWLNLYFNK